MHIHHTHLNAWQALFSADEREHSARVHAHIAAQIAQAGGWLDFARFMELALYAPGLGYYSAGAHKLGAGGDFTTAPEISPLFSRCVALQMAQILRETGGSVLELGAGSGVMAADILLELERQNCLPERYCILEISADLRDRQQALLRDKASHLFGRVHWLDTLPKDFVGAIVANEVLDALPVSRFVMRHGEPQALGVAIQNENFVWQARPVSADLENAVQVIEHEIGHRLPEGYSSEVNLQLGGWLRALSESLQCGHMLFIDYGYPRAQYYSADRRQGTLSCFCKQRMHDDPLINVGVQDITSWVDFTALAETGLAAGLELKGFATQAHFLIGSGLQQLTSNFSELADAERWSLSHQIQKLTLPGEMGESFKAMAFAKDCDIELSGFAFRDLRDRL